MFILISPPYHTFKLGKPAMPPLGLAILAAMLREKNIKVDIVDCGINEYNFNDLRKILQKKNQNL